MNFVKNRADLLKRMKRKIFLSLSLLLLATMAMAEGKQPAQADAPTQTAYTQSQQEDAPLGVRFYTRYGKVMEIIKAKANGNDVYLVFYDDGIFTAFRSDEGMESVTDVHFIDHSYKKESLDMPPYVQELVYHDLGEGKEFCGIKLYKEIKNKNTGKVSHVKYEYKLDDDSAQKIIDLIAGDSKWTNRTDIEFSETTNPSVALPKVVWVEED